MKQKYAMSLSTSIKLMTGIALCLFSLLTSSGCTKQSAPQPQLPQPITQPTASTASMAPITGMEKDVPDIKGIRSVVSLSKTMTSTQHDPSMETMGILNFEQCEAKKQAALAQAQTAEPPVPPTPQAEKSEKKKEPEKKETMQPKTISIEKTLRALNNELDFEVENRTGKTVYVTCFSYLRRQVLGHWRWSKSPIYELKDNQSTIIDIVTINDSDDRKNVFGYLGVYASYNEAHEATYELAHDKQLLDLDLITQLKNKKVVIDVERYGFKEPFLDYDFVDLAKSPKKVPELDFFVINNTGKTIYVAGFSYEKKAKGTWIAAIDEKDDMSTWRFDKTKVLKLVPGKTGYIDIDTVFSGRDRTSVLGYLAIFDEDEEKKANEATFELLEPKQKISLGPLNLMQNKTITLEVEKYGVSDEIIEYTVKPTRKIDFTKIAQ